jgi:hypothetical protein
LSRFRFGGLLLSLSLALERSLADLFALGLADAGALARPLKLARGFAGGIPASASVG